MITIEIEQNGVRQLVGKKLVPRLSILGCSFRGDMVNDRCIIVISHVLPVVIVPKGGKIEIWME